MDTPIVKNRFSPSQRIISPKGKYPARQQFKDDADLNSIMKKFQKTGAMDHVKIYESEYGFASPTDYHNSLNVILKAETMFADLPSTVRNRFKNNPAEFLEFVQNPENQEEAAELGLTTAPLRAPEALSEPSGTAKTDEEGGSPAGKQDTPPEAE